MTKSPLQSATQKPTTPTEGWETDFGDVLSKWLSGNHIDAKVLYDHIRTKKAEWEAAAEDFVIGELMEIFVSHPPTTKTLVKYLLRKKEARHADLNK